MNKNIKAITIIISSFLLLTGCVKTKDRTVTGTPQEIITQSRAENGYSIAEKIQSLVTYKNVSYNGFDKKSPFEKFENKTIKINSENTIKPDFDRKKEHLELFDMSVLHLVGIIEGKDGGVGIINNGNETLIVKVGNYIGKNFGKIKKINNKTMVVEEIVKNENDSWVKKELILNLKKKIFD